MKTRNPQSRLFRSAKSRLGTTLAEVSVMSFVTVLISMVVVDLMYETGVATKDIYAETRTRQTRTIALDQIRYELGGAVVDTIQVTNANRRIQFTNRKHGWSTVSQFDFIPSTRKLMFDPDINDNEGAYVVAQGPIELTFELDQASSGGLVRVNVKSAADVAFGDVDTQDGETAIFLRNA